MVESPKSSQKLTPGVIGSLSNMIPKKSPSINRRKSTIAIKVTSMDFTISSENDSFKAKQENQDIIHPKQSIEEIALHAFEDNKRHKIVPEHVYNQIRKDDLIEKYGIQHLTSIIIDTFSLRYYDPIEKKNLKIFDELYHTFHCNPELTDNCLKLLLLFFGMILIRDIVFIAQGLTNALAFIKFVLIFPSVFWSMWFVQTPSFYSNSRLILFPVFLITEGIILDYIFFSYGFSIGLMTVVYVAPSFTILSAWDVLMVNILNFTSYNIFAGFHESEILQQDASEYIYNLCFQLIFIGIICYRTFLFEFGSRTNFLQLQIMIKQNKDLRHEKKKNEELIKTILPSDVIIKMKLHEPIIFDFPSVTIMFIMICDFAKISSILSLEDLIKLLNTIYSEFDLICETNFVHKVETVGEVYMAVAGCPMKAQNHAVLAANAALAIQERMPKLTERIKNSIGMLGVSEIQVKIGLNTGPVVAGLIGKENPRYKLFGDTVNTSSRMESTSEPGKIQCTGSTEILLRGKFKMTNRGKQAIKGKGMLETFYITDYGQHKIPSIPEFGLTSNKSEASDEDNAAFRDPHLRNIFRNAKIHQLSRNFVKITKKNMIVKASTKNLVPNGKDAKSNGSTSPISPLSDNDSITSSPVAAYDLDYGSGSRDASPTSLSASNSRQSSSKSLFASSNNISKRIHRISMQKGMLVEKLLDEIDIPDDILSEIESNQGSPPVLQDVVVNTNEHQENTTKGDKMKNKTIAERLNSLVTKKNAVISNISIEGDAKKAKRTLLNPYVQSLVLDKAFQLPDFYINVYSALTALPFHHPLEEHYHTDVLRRLTIPYSVKTFLLVLLLGVDSLLYKHLKPSSFYASCEPALTVTLLYYRELIKFAVVLPAGLLTLALSLMTTLHRRRLIFVYATLVFIVGLGLITISVMGGCINQLS